MAAGPAPARPVAAVVVNFNAAGHLAGCLRSLAANGLPTVIVVDNGSVDGSERVVRAAGAGWLPTGANLGYGRGANRGGRTRAQHAPPTTSWCATPISTCVPVPWMRW